MSVCPPQQNILQLCLPASHAFCPCHASHTSACHKCCMHARQCFLKHKPITSVVCLQDLFANCLQLCLQAAPHAIAATHSAQALAALLASQPCTLPARSGDAYCSSSILTHTTTKLLAGPVCKLFAAVFAGSTTRNCCNTGSLRDGYHIQGRQQARKLPNPDTGR